jgi:hypothetical protein
MLTSLFKFLFHAIAPLGVAGGGGDGGAKQARKDEQDRQARIAAAVAKINGIFDGKEIVTGTEKVSSYKPGQTYFDADGKQWTAPVITTPAVKGRADSSWRKSKAATSTIDSNAVARALQDGLFSKVGKITPASNRSELYDTQKKAVFDINKLDIDKQQQQAERENRFGLARAGLLGGKVDIDANADIQERTSKGIMEATALGDQAAADLKTADERSRQSLISLAQSGIDTGTAQGMALRQLDATAQDAAANRGGATIGSLFGDMSQAYLLRQARAGQLAGRTPANQWYGVSNPRSGDGGTINQ